MPRARIAVIAPSSSAIVEPFSGGLAAHVWSLTNALCERGHDVTLFAAPGSDPHLPIDELALDRLSLSDAAQRDLSMPSTIAMAEHHAYLSLMLRLARQPDRWDVVHNHSLHYLPVAMASTVAIPMITTLHTPPTPWLESAIKADLRSPIRFVAVSRFTADQWGPLVDPITVIANGVDLNRWAVGRGGDDLVWSGRLVPEKAPHLAVLAARMAGRRIRLAGPIGDRRYFAEQVQPLLGAGAEYVGHLSQAELSLLVRTSSALVATPIWDEPYGLVVAEALASGTPVAAFARGGIPEVVDATCARLAEPGNVTALADAIGHATQLDRHAARRRAERHCAMDVMVDQYEQLLFETVAA